MFSRQCEYALQAVMYLALKPEDEMTSIKELTQKLDTPYHFLGKILQNLTHKGLLKSLKGPSGGFALALPSEEINLLQIIEAIDGVSFTKGCVLGFPECSKTDPCALHDQWGPSRDSIIAMLKGKSVSEMAHKMKKPQYLMNKRSSG